MPLRHLMTPDLAVCLVGWRDRFFLIISAYLPCREDIRTDLRSIEKVLDDLPGKQVVLCSDTNAWHTGW